MCQGNHSRRRFIGRLVTGSFALTPLAAALAACSRGAAWPEGMSEIKWERDACTRCRMVISDPRFAAEARGGPKDEVFKFDDIGCAVVWLNSQPWGRAARIWVADAASENGNVAWLDARKAFYMSGKKSPMAYNCAAYGLFQTGSLEFGDMAAQVLAKGR